MLKARLDESGLIAEDVACRDCGYNLRGLRIEATCPECSIPIGRSVFGDLLRYCNPAWLARVARGLWWIIIGLLTSVASYLLLTIVMIFVMASQATGISTFDTTQSVISILTGLVAIIGVWFATSPEPAVIETESTISARRLARWCILAQLFAGPLRMLDSSVATLAVAGGMSSLQLLGLLLGLVAIVGYVATLVYLRQLARRMERRKLATQTTIVMWGLVCTSGVGLLYSLIFSILMPVIAGAASGLAGAMTYLATGIYVLLSAWLVFGVWAIVLLFIYAFRLQRVAAEAKDTWVPQTTTE